MTKVYFAGKVKANDFRNEIANVRDELCMYNGNFDTIRDKKNLSIKISENFDYVGPYLMGDDHCSYHGEGTHGVGVGKNRNEIMDGESYPPLSKSTLFSLCIHQIDRADAIFCYIDEEGAYGTAFELGYAYAKDIPIYLYFKDESTEKIARDMWFSTIKAIRVAYNMTAKEAWEDFSSVFGNEEELKKRTVEQASPAQVNFIKSLAKQKKISLNSLDEIKKPTAGMLIAFLKNFNRTKKDNDYTIPKDTEQYFKTAYFEDGAYRIC